MIDALSTSATISNLDPSPPPPYPQTHTYVAFSLSKAENNPVIKGIQTLIYRETTQRRYQSRCREFARCTLKIPILNHCRAPQYIWQRQAFIQSKMLGNFVAALDFFFLPNRSLMDLLNGDCCIFK